MSEQIRQHRNVRSIQNSALGCEDQVHQRRPWRGVCLLGDSNGRCHCSPDQVRRYRARISGPLLDRIDLQIEVARIPHDKLHDAAESGECSATVRARVETVRELQLRDRGMPNSQLGTKEIQHTCRLAENDRLFLVAAVEKLGLSARAGHKILKVARTVADLDQSEHIRTQHLAEAITLRRPAATWFD